MKNLAILSFVLLSFTVIELSAAPVSLRERSEMDFATIFILPGGDTVVLTPAAGISSSNGSIFTGSPQAARFSAQGDKNAAASISFSTGDVLTGPGTSMPIGNFTHDAGPTPAFTSNKKLDFNVGATLTINPNQVSGSYSGVFTVTVD